MKNIKVLKLNNEFSLYDPRSTDLFNLIEEALTFSTAQDLLVLNFQNQCSDFRLNWYRKIKSGCYRDELGEHFKSFSRFCQKLRKSTTKTAIFLRGECLDSYAELALSCDFIFCTDVYSEIGFSMSAGSAFPVAGSWLDVDDKIHSSHQTLWSKLGPIKIETATKYLTTCHFCPYDVDRQADEVLEYASNIAKQLAGQKIKVQKKNLRKRTFPEAKLGTIFDSYQNKVKALGIESFTMFNRKYSEYSDLMTRAFFTNSYWRYIRSGWTQNKFSKNTQVLGNQETIYICLDLAIPSRSLLRKLMKNFKFIVFYGGSVETFQSSLQLVSSRVATFAENDFFQDYWKNNVSWFVGELPQERSYLSAHPSRSRKTIFRLLGDELAVYPITPDYEWVEVSGELQGFPFLEQLFKGAIVQNQSLHCPLTIIVQSVFLEELVRLAKNSAHRFGFYLSCMENSKWGTVSSAKFWDKFLNQRYLYFEYPANFSFHQNAIDRELWELQGLKAIEQYISSHHKIGHFKNTPIEVDNYLSIFVGLLSLRCEQNLFGGDRDLASVFVAKSLGFPAGKGYPNDYLFENMSNSLAYINLSNESDYVRNAISSSSFCI